MKRWVVLTVALYAAVLLLGSVPVFFLMFPEEIGKVDSLKPVLDGYIELFPAIGPMTLLFAGGAFLLLIVPVDNTERRWQSRRVLALPVLSTSFFLALLVVMSVFCVFCAIWGDDWPVADNEALFYFWLLAFPTAVWGFWAWLFYSYSSGDTSEGMLRRATAWLLRGSILEFLVAVVCHIVVRRRNDCCAPMLTGLGISMALAIMLMAMGPGVLFLFLERAGERKSRRDREAHTRGKAPDESSS